ncbi:HIT domain-containing protein [Bdellovibrionota bacterium]
MALKQIWAPWRMKYILNEEAGGCVFCEYLNQKTVQEPVLHISDHSFVVMNTFPYNSGHILVVSKKHVKYPEELSKEEYFDLCELVRVSAGVLTKQLQADGINVGLNIGKAAGAGMEHLHYHLVPRWVGDTNFMPIVGETKVIAEHITATYEKLLPGFSSGG